MTTNTTTCARELCTNAFDWPEALSYLSDVLCDDCEAVRGQEREAGERAAKAERIGANRLSALNAITAATPDRYRDTRIDHPEFNRDLWHNVSDWQPTREKPWLGIVGAESGGCKTRVAFLVLQKIIADASSHFGFEAIASYQLKRAALAQYRSRDDDSPRRLLDRLATTDNLLLDDIGKAKHTPAVAEELFTIIDHRYANLLPIIWTSNCHPRHFASDIADRELAGPLVGRILECSTIIDLDS